MNTRQSLAGVICKQFLLCHITDRYWGRVCLILIKGLYSISSVTLKNNWSLNLNSNKMKCTYQMEDRRHKREVSNGVGQREELNEN